MQTIGLVMIVKDEAAVIERCLYSVLPYIDYWTIVDTGSTDGTQEITQKFFRDAHIEGRLIEVPWTDFGTARSQALEYGRASGCDYSLMIDADDVLAVPVGYNLPHLEFDCYYLNIRHVTIQFPRVQLFKNSVNWYYKGVIHEYPECPVPPSSGHLKWMMQTSREGARSQDPKKYHKDALGLEKALETETDAFLRTRYTFYLAQSYRDAGMPGQALATYVARAEMGGYPEEVYYSLYQAMKISNQLHSGRLIVEGFYLRANSMGVHRSEHAHFFGWFLRQLTEYQEAVNVLRPHLLTKLSNTALFGEPWVYDYGIQDEISVSLFWAGKPTESLMQLLSCIQKNPNSLPPAVVERMANNAAHCVRRMAQPVDVNQTS